MQIFHKSDAFLNRVSSLAMVELDPAADRDAIAPDLKRGRRANFQISPRISNATSDNKRLFLQHTGMLIFACLLNMTFLAISQRSVDALGAGCLSKCVIYISNIVNNSPLSKTFLINEGQILHSN